eukprot:m.259143 g.259143  ORF g.259143 m.259143 type:complete len:394 (-) comp37611_c0_seq1:108-1289(-)
MKVDKANQPLIGINSSGASTPKKPTGFLAVIKGFAAYVTLFCMMASWILEGELNQNLVGGCPAANSTTTNDTELLGAGVNMTGFPCYENHFFMAFCTRICWSLTFIVWYLWKLCLAPVTTYENDPKNLGRGMGLFSWRTYLKWSTGLGIVIFASTYTWYLSLPLTSMAGNSAVYMTAPVFVFIFSVPLLKEKVTFLKVLATLLCVAGSAVVAVYGSAGASSGDDSFIGYVWVIVSVVLYSGFEVFYKKYTCDPEDPFPVANSQRFFGMCGIAAVLTMWPFFFVFNDIHGTYGEPFTLPDWDAVPLVIIISLADTMFNVFLLLTILLSSPLFTSIGTVAVIPLTSLTDYLYRDLTLTPLGFGGAAMILVGFVCMVIAENQHHKKKTTTAYDDIM